MGIFKKKIISFILQSCPKAPVRIRATMCYKTYKPKAGDSPCPGHSYLHLLFVIAVAVIVVWFKKEQMNKSVTNLNAFSFRSSLSDHRPVFLV